MIAKLSGRLDGIGGESVIIDVGGVGYLVFCSARTLAAVGRRGEAIELLIETHVREDHIHLYGFSAEAERDWFRLLQSVQGVGARVALAILSVHAPGELAGAIASQDKAAVSQAQGVGGKLAARIVSELRDAVGNVIPGPSGATVTGAAISPVGTSEGDAVSALVNLGYRRTEANSAVAGALREVGVGAPLDSLIRAGLRELAR